MLSLHNNKIPLLLLHPKKTNLLLYLKNLLKRPYLKSPNKQKNKSRAHQKNPKKLKNKRSLHQKSQNNHNSRSYQKKPNKNSNNRRQLN